MSASTVVAATALKQDYNTVVEGLANDAFKAALAYFENLVDEEGNKLAINFEDVCNMVTNAAQAARRNYVAENNKKGTVPIATAPAKA